MAVLKRKDLSAERAALEKARRDMVARKAHHKRRLTHILPEHELCADDCHAPTLAKRVQVARSAVQWGHEEAIISGELFRAENRTPEALWTAVREICNELRIGDGLLTEERCMIIDDDAVRFLIRLIRAIAECKAHQAAQFRLDARKLKVWAHEIETMR